MLKKLNLADRCTWFIPGHSAESFPDEVQQVVESGCEIGLHGYAHEGAYQMTPEQERDVLTRCIEIAKKLTGKNPVGYRAPLYQLRESTLDLLEEFGFEYGIQLANFIGFRGFFPLFSFSFFFSNLTRNRCLANRRRLPSILRTTPPSPAPN